MQLTHRSRVKTLFDEAQAYAPEQRAAFPGADAYFDSLGHALRGADRSSL